jgi:hypothetical protein
MELDFLQELLDTPQETKEWFDELYPPSQKGPLIRYEREMRCVSPHTYSGKKNCGSSTYYKLEGIPTCMTHALTRMNEMLIEHGM